MFKSFRALFENHGRAIQGLVIAFLLLGGVGMVLTLSAPLLGIDGVNSFQLWLGSVDRIWALPATVIGFAVLAFIGVPQVALIGAAIVVFGPWAGSIYSWAGTLVSSLVGFFLGRAFGARLLRDYGGEKTNQLMRIIGRHGFMASLMVRQAPLAPFVVVNMAAGVTPMRMLSFAGGTAVGIIPKIALIALGGHAVAEAAKRLIRDPASAWTDPQVLIALVMLLLGIGFWLWAGLVARDWLKKRGEEDKLGESE